MKSICILGRTIVAGVFVVAGATKLNAPEEFSENLMRYGFFSDAVAGTIATVFPGIELLVGISILTKRFAGAGITVASAMSLLFVVMLACVVVSGGSIDCGCFGSFFPASAPAALVRAAILTAICLMLLHRHISGKLLPPCDCRQECRRVC